MSAVVRRPARPTHTGFTRPLHVGSSAVKLHLREQRVEIFVVPSRPVLLPAVGNQRADQVSHVKNLDTLSFLSNF